MEKQAILIKLGIVIPEKTPCYLNKIAITSVRLNWLSPLTYAYLACSIIHLLYVMIRYGKEFTDRFQTNQLIKKPTKMNIIEGLHSEMDRVREIIKEYDSVPNNAGAFASGMMKQSIKNAEAAIATGDTIGMMKCYDDLKEYEL